MRGYFGKPELTAERFVNDPFVAGNRLYRTGDLGRLSRDGELEYVGRKDDQVTVSFRDVTGGLKAYNGQPNAFELCDAKTCRWAQASLAGNAVTLSNAGNAMRVRYCWGDSPICTLTDDSALPAGPFEIPIQ